MLMAWGLFSANSAQAQPKRLCMGDKATLACLKENFTEVYEKQYYQFQIILGNEEKKALSCESIADTAAFLELAGKIADNPEVEDYFRDFLETKFLKESPVCLLDALLQVDSNSRNIIVGKYLSRPMYLKKQEVDAILSGYKEEERYKDMLK